MWVLILAHAHIITGGRLLKIVNLRTYIICRRREVRKCVTRRMKPLMEIINLKIYGYIGVQQCTVRPVCGLLKSKAPLKLYQLTLAT
jgi:hypothetical protein